MGEATAYFLGGLLGTGGLAGMGAMCGGIGFPTWAGSFGAGGGSAGGGGFGPPGASAAVLGT